jgi:ribosomal protein S7
MKRGQEIAAERIVYTAIDKSRKFRPSIPLEVVNKAIEKVRPSSW